MLRERRGDVDDALPRGMREADPPRMQAELVLDAQRELSIAAVFLVAQNRMADDRHMRAQLMLAPGHWLERDEGDLLPRAVDHGVMRHRRLRHILLAGARLA